MTPKVKASSNTKPKKNSATTAQKRTASSRQKSTAKRSAVRYALRLYITGQTPRSLQSVENLRALCDKYIPNQFDLEVVDIYQQPAMAAAGQIIAAPTLIKSMPLPLRRLVGDFSDQNRVILGLDIRLNEEQGSA
ncbi:MAG TPA: circadian clock KaiB family protein [Candidatus Acidoferrum sp.]|jgi:circadian clock protein KaiB|nr:circadian clock KaiB family protein [Candidatus Acidoferrum sp.]